MGEGIGATHDLAGKKELGKKEGIQTQKQSEPKGAELAEKKELIYESRVKGHKNVETLACIKVASESEEENASVPVLMKKAPWRLKSQTVAVFSKGVLFRKRAERALGW